MKTIRIIVVVIFVTILILPICFFNFRPDVISEIDNRKLAENPFSEEGDKTTNIEKYINDRLGFRDDMITGYTIFNDVLFGTMVHPTYTYGKDGYVFGAGITTENTFGEYHIAFANMVKTIQDYCEARNVPFLFVFNPAKPAVYQDKLAKGINYNRDWVTMFFAELDKRNVNYIDNTSTMKELRLQNEDGFNIKFDANHWNYNGAFYGTNKILTNLKERCPSVHINTKEEFEYSLEHKTSLLVSKFPIDEYIPRYDGKELVINKYEEYSALKLDAGFKGFYYYENGLRASENSPKALVFQGSYMNSYGYKFLANSFGEYIAVHDYQNVIDFPYYYNIFQPDCVVFEVAEYTFNDSYFNYEKMMSINYNPTLESLSSSKTINVLDSDLIVDTADNLTTITWRAANLYDHAWFENNGIVYDMFYSDKGYNVTIDTQNYKNQSEYSIYVS